MKNTKYHIIFIIVIVALFTNNLYNENNLYKNIEKAEELKDYNSLEDKLSYITGKIDCSSLVSDNEYLNNFKPAILKKTVEIYRHDTTSIRPHIIEEKWKTYYSPREIDLVPKGNKKNEDFGIFYFYPDTCKINNIEIPINKFVANNYTTIQFPNSQLDTKENSYYLYFGNKDINNPEIGDVRIKYEVYLGNKKSTILLNNNKYLRFEDMSKINSIYTDNILKTIYNGTKDDLLKDLKSNEKLMKFLINILLAIILFIPLFEFFIVLFNKKYHFNKFISLSLITILSAFFSYIILIFILFITNFISL